ncbi:MAG TPA: hypothetical protein VFE96_06070 [Candidatus Bathyarchaeia archaeon]|nr:hypothetical protein [Candidatus Bathyarchaeia archaeon]
MNEIEKTRTSDRLSFVTALGLKHIYFYAKGASETARRSMMPDKNGVVWALRKGENVATTNTHRGTLLWTVSIT